MPEQLRAGGTCSAVSFMPPLDRYKRSGLGRENGQEAICEYSAWAA
jgi:hypothetical protein